MRPNAGKIPGAGILAVGRPQPRRKHRLHRPARPTTPCMSSILAAGPVTAERTYSYLALRDSYHVRNPSGPPALPDPSRQRPTPSETLGSGQYGEAPEDVLFRYRGQYLLKGKHPLAVALADRATQPVNLNLANTYSLLTPGGIRFITASARDSIPIRWSRSRGRGRFMSSNLAPPHPPRR
jgi:hypothetical protein